MSYIEIGQRGTPENKIAEIRLKIKGNDLMATKQLKHSKSHQSSYRSHSKTTGKTKEKKKVNYKSKKINLQENEIGKNKKRELKNLFFLLQIMSF